MKYIALLRGINVDFLYNSRIIFKSQEQLTKIFSEVPSDWAKRNDRLITKKTYKDITIRNYNTTRKLLELMK